jgi:Tol biopolymer transport system component
MKIANVFGWWSWLVMGCGGDGGGLTEPPPDNHEQMVLESIPYSALGTTKVTFSRDELPKRGVITLDGVSRTGAITYSVFGPWVAMSPTSSALAFLGYTPASNRQRSADIYMRSWEASNGTPLGGPGGMRGTPSWTSDGSRVVFAEATDNFAIVFDRVVSQSPVPSATDRQVLWSASNSCEFVYNPRQNATGRLVFVYFPSRQSCFLEGKIGAATPGGVAQILYDPGDLGVYSPTWSPAGEEIAFFAVVSFDQTGFVNVALKRMAADGSNIRTITLLKHYGGTHEFDFSMCWPGDGSRILFNTYDAPEVSHIYSVAVADGALTQITSASGVRDGSVSCSN